MKTQLTLLAACLLSTALVQGQTTMPVTTSTQPLLADTTQTASATPTSDTTQVTGTTQAIAPAVSPATTPAKATNPGTWSSTPSEGNTTSATGSTRRPAKANDYKNFAFGVYAGVNTTRFRGENGQGEPLSGRLGYQAGFLVRGGGRLYGQLGAEYLASSSTYYRAGDGNTLSDIQDQINIQYIQIPVYLGYKLVQSGRGISAVRLQAGLAYANRISANSNSFNLSQSEVKSGTFNALGQVGFDLGPAFIDLTYHHGLGNSIEAVTASGFAGSQRRVLSASVGLKF